MYISRIYQHSLFTIYLILQNKNTLQSLRCFIFVDRNSIFTFSFPFNERFSTVILTGINYRIKAKFWNLSITKRRWVIFSSNGERFRFYYGPLSRFGTSDSRRKGAEAGNDAPNERFACRGRFSLASCHVYTTCGLIKREW